MHLQSDDDFPITSGTFDEFFRVWRACVDKHELLFADLFGIRTVLVESSRRSRKSLRDDFVSAGLIAGIIVRYAGRIVYRKSAGRTINRVARVLRQTKKAIAP